MRIYFAGSIRGGRDDAATYRRMIEKLKERHTVLTEHVGDLSLSPLEGESRPERQIYERDIAWLTECDLVVAECTMPSLGVGYELAYAEKLGKRVCVFYRADRSRLSAMIAGDSYFEIYAYKSEAELMEKLACVTDG